MVRRLNISENFKDIFQQLVGLLPHELRDDVQTQNSVWVFFKFGGEKTARQYIEIINMQFRKKIEEEIEKLEVPNIEDSENELYVSPQEDDTERSDPDDLDDDDAEDDSDIY